jgi:uncharacterized protein with HEPN domain
VDCGSRSRRPRRRRTALPGAPAVEIIGEAAKKVSPTTRSRADSIPWQEIAGMRDRLIHAYFDVNLDLLWNTVNDDLPPLIADLEAILANDISA